MKIRLELASESIMVLAINKTNTDYIYMYI